MALGEGGIDSQVQDRMDAYRNNPQKLKQNYGKNKELLDLMALQKLNKQKKDTAAAMQLAQEQDPGTIAQQREQEALALVKAEMGGTLGELTNRTSDTLGQQKKVQDKARGNVGKPAQGGGLAGLLGAKPPMRNPRAPTGNPAAQGLAGARMAQAATQTGGPRRMAQGGIVGFAGGQEVGTTPLQRKLGGFKKYFTDSKTRIDLQNEVKKKFRGFAAPVTGAFTKQSDQQQAYAKSIMAAIPELDNVQLNDLLALPFTADMSGYDVSSLPPVPSGSSSTETETETDGGPAELPPRVDGRTIDPATGLPYSPITYEAPKPYESEVSQLTREDLTVAPVVPATPDTTDVDTAQENLLKTVGSIPDGVDVVDVAKAPLEAVPSSSYLSPQGIKAENELLRRAGEDFDKDPNVALDDARASADLYGLREEKQEISKENLEKLFSLKPRIEKVAIKDAKLRTFIADDANRDELVAHVYDITYGSIKETDTLVIIDDSIVRGTTLQKSILKILDRLSPKKIIVVSSAPQIRYPDCYGIDMAKMEDFIAFRAAIGLLKSEGKETLIKETYQDCLKELKLPISKMKNRVLKIYADYSDEDISDQISKILKEKDIKTDVQVIFQTVQSLHSACPKNLGDWYFTGDYPTPGGNKVVNQSFVNYYEGAKKRAY